MKTISRRVRPTTITVFNYISSAAGVATYQKTQIDMVHLDRGYRQRLNQRGIQTEDDALLILDLSDYTATSNRTFKEPEQWNALTTQQKAGHFTFKAPEDFFILGTATETMPNTTKSAMQIKYRCFAVSSATLPASDKAGPVILEVTGR